MMRAWRCKLRMTQHEAKLLLTTPGQGGSSWRILSVTTQPDVDERILHHLDLPTEPPSSEN